MLGLERAVAKISFLFDILDKRLLRIISLLETIHEALEDSEYIYLEDNNGPSEGSGNSGSN